MIQKKYRTLLLSDSKMKDKLSQLKNDKTSNLYKLDISVPDNFDGRTVWSKYINDIDDQSSCMSCWAYTTLFVLSTRLAIYTKGLYNLKLSVAKMIFLKKNLHWDNNNPSFDYLDSNDKQHINMCSSNSLLEAWQYLYCFGVCEEKCIGYKANVNHGYTSDFLFGKSFDICPSTGEEMINHRIDGYYYVPGTAISKNLLFNSGSEYNIRREIFHWGPCSTVMRVFDDFLNWDGNGIYKWDSKSKQSSDLGHAIVLIGWGEEKGVKYWIVRNSWSNKWGVDNGYFKMIRGINNCEIEENVIVGYPTLPSIKMFIEHPILYRFDDFILRGKWGIQDNGYKLSSYEKLKLNNSQIKNFIYDVESWPDFNKMISGNKIKNDVVIEKFNNECVEDNEDDNSLNCILLMLLFLIVVRKFFKCGCA